MRRVISGVPQSYGCQNMLNQRSDAPASKAAASGGLSARFACEAVAVSGSVRPAVRKAAASVTEKSSVDTSSKKTRRHKAVLADEFNKAKALELLRAGNIRGAGSLSICGSKPRGGSVSLKLNKQTGKGFVCRPSSVRFGLGLPYLYESNLGTAS